MEQAVIDGRELAATLKTHPGSIRAHRAGLRATAILEGLPPPLQTKPKLLWLKADIEAWLETKRTFRPDAPATKQAELVAPEGDAPRRRGRPRKSEREREREKEQSV